MEFFLFLLYNQESSREKYFPAKRGEINMKGTSCEFCANYTYDEECDEYTAILIWMKTSTIVL